MRDRIGRHRVTPLLVGLICMAGPVELAAGGPQAPARRGEQVRRTEKAYPTGDKTTSVVLLERLAPAEIRAGQAFNYAIKITNLTRAEIADVVVTEQFPAAFRIGSILPEPTGTGERSAAWEWEKLGPQETKEIRVSGSTEQTEDLTYCATVTFNTVVCATTRVVQPQLALTKHAPAEVLICDPIPLRFVVGNTGSGVARNVRIADKLPEGWKTTDGRTSLAFDAGDLAAGQSREFTVNVRSSQTGRFTNTATAAEEGGLSAEATATTTVRQPVLAVAKSGPDFRYIGRPAKFEITVANEGDAAAANTVVVDAVPAGTDFVTASDGGQLADGKVTWNLGTLAAGESRIVSLTVTPTRRGTVQNTAVAKAVCAEGSASARMEVRGIPAILLEVIDLHDPIEVGGNETYEIVVVNQGSADGTNIVITCTLPAEQEYVSAAGPTQAQAAGKTVRFAPLRSLAPKAKATYRLVVKGVQAADVRFKVSMTSDQVDSPVEETESTHIY
jgi:uncharacterized repeat protein (TIGR01451 family)